MELENGLLPGGQRGLHHLHLQLRELRSGGSSSVPFLFCESCGSGFDEFRVSTSFDECRVSSSFDEYQRVSSFDEFRRVRGLRSEDGGLQTED